MADNGPINKFSYEVLTPQGRVDSGQTVSVSLPAVDGGIGILARRAPLVAELGAGRMTVHRPDGPAAEYFVAGGFAQVREGGLTVLAEECIPAASLDRQAALAELDRARRLPTDTDADWDRRTQAIAIARTKLYLIEEQSRPAP